MKSERNISYFLRNMNVKHRLSVRNQHDDTEVWYMHISPAAMIASLLAFTLVLFIVIVSIAAFTPLLDMVPGYPGNRSREALIENIIRIDSMEQRLAEIETYTENISLIMSGKVPTQRIAPRITADSLRSRATGETVRNAADSAIRSQIEGDGPYALTAPADALKARIAGLQLTTPVKGVISSSFAPMEGDFGTGITAAPGQEIVAVADGTVITALWSPSENYMVQIQHPDNMVSVYRHCGRLLKATGERVKAGEVVGYTPENHSDGESGGRVGIELWYNGSPVDPENYITF